MKRGHKGGIELVIVQYCQEDSDFNKKRSQRSDKNAKVMKFQNFPNFAENFIQLLGYAVCWSENYGREKKVYKQKTFFGGKNFLFFENIFGGHFYISQFVLL